jgi:hypothetical protein
MKFRKICAWCQFACILLVFGVAPTHAEIVLYNQATDNNGAYASQNDTSGFGNFATAYDDFTLGASALVTRVDWVGSYFNLSVQGAITAFTLTVWSDYGGQPGSSLFSESINGASNEVAVNTNSGSDAFGDPEFNYSANLPFNAIAGTQYWLSIVPDLAFPSLWGWETSTGTESSPVSYQDYFGTRSQNPTDLAFTLLGNPGGNSVPEPGSLTLLCLGLASFTGMAWMKRRNAAAT